MSAPKHIRTPLARVLGRARPGPAPSILAQRLTAVANIR